MIFSKKIHLYTILFIFSVVSFWTREVLAQGSGDQYGLDRTAGSAGLTTVSSDVPTLIGNIVGTALSMIGVLFFILMVYGGFLWMTARGNEEQTTKAKNTITAAVIGIIIVLASYAITNFVFRSLQTSGGQSCGATVGDPLCYNKFVGDSCSPPGDPGDTFCRLDTTQVCTCTSQ